MSVINAALRPLFVILMWPFRELPPILPVALVSLLLGVIALYVYKYTSNQEALANIKRRIAASFFEIRLFNDDVLAILRAQADLLLSNLRYMGLNLIPLLVMIVPFTLVMAQLQFHLGYEALEPGKPMIVTLGLDNESAVPPEAALEAPAGVSVETQPVWAQPLSEVSWRIRAAEPGQYTLHLRIGDTVLDKSLEVGPGVRLRSPERRVASFVNELLYPAEEPIPKTAGVKVIRIAYPEADVALGPLSAHWLVLVVVLSVVFAFLLKDRLGVVV